MAYKLIALDMDGTLLNKQKEISAGNIKWIRAAMDAGVKVTLATGRPIREVAPYAEQLGLECPLVVNNGSEVWKAPGVLHFRKELDPNRIADIMDILQTYGDEADFWAHTVEGLVNKTNVPSDLAHIHWLQFAIRCANPVTLQEIRDRLTSWQTFEISNSHITNIECNALGISKASGLTEVCSLLGIDMSDVIAMGDSLNDIPMIRAAGLGVAMGNAQEPVKLIADAIAPPHHEDGVANIIEKYIFS
ncbi:Cof-type HAD-IIB family hydrolase [Paenibacillus filicis]|uniref:Cof-type HAD-IIB family hydrolase n=1 Tax=Paenibacillus gyeongsangnamensis TaxID=3388067 RepID=A0ABT4Q4M7_9BACL|nr:Cof-type HAD-IIB family hydrolase [Paenibacillus filicis]MCZ8511645.1 Cof-type HAD-IIB family hydrolase [Paenibacillus filicis]